MENTDGSDRQRDHDSLSVSLRNFLNVAAMFQSTTVDTPETSERPG